MIRSLIRYDLGRIRLVYGLLLSFLIVYLLLPADPFDAMDPGILGLAIAIGCYVAMVVFSDSANTHVWIFSRGLTRDNLFYHRLSLGVILIGIAALLPLLVVVLGLRSSIHQETSPYYPTVRWLELPIAKTFFLVAISAFCVQGCLGSLRLLAGKTASGRTSQAFSIAVELIATFVICTSLLSALSLTGHRLPSLLVTATVPLLAIALAWLMLLARHAWRNFEID